MTTRVMGPQSWGPLARDKDSYVTYKIKHLVEGDTTDGPAAILATPGLPQPGDPWNFGNDADLAATCLWEATVAQHQAKEGSPHCYWTVEQTFSSKPPDSKRCNDEQITDPLLEPPKISGGGVKYAEEATRDRFGRPIVNSAHEQMRGPQVEFDNDRAQIKIEMNVPSFDTIILAYTMRNTLNVAPLWGFGRRCIKLSGWPWERKYKGRCEVYYQLTLEFEIRPDASFDKDLLDEGSKVLKGRWVQNAKEDRYVVAIINGQTANRFNPTHFKRFTDIEGNPIRGLLNGRGLPATIVAGTSAEFLSIADGNVGNALTNRDKWIPLPRTPAGIFEEPDDWDVDRFYEQGELVSYKPPPGFPDPSPPVMKYYVCIADVSVADNPTLIGSTSWRELGTKDPLATDSTFYRTRGNYSESTSYSKMDYVRDTENTTAGNIRVEKYNESDFLRLGVPATF